jgi:hypothetical protein
VDVPGFGRGGAPQGPLVMPGTYAVRVTIPGVKEPLAGRVVVEGDPLPKFAAADRAARQAILMRVYDWTRTLGEARTALRALSAQRDSIKSDLGSPADSLNARITRLGADVDRAFNAVNAQRAPIEGWSGLPSVDQRKAIDYALDDARKAMADLNKLVATDIPAAYKVAKKEWGRAVKGVAAPSVGKAP